MVMSKADAPFEAARLIDVSQFDQGQQDHSQPPSLAAVALFVRGQQDRS